jgi:hypothetical protein
MVNYFYYSDELLVGVSSLVDLGCGCGYVENGFCLHISWMAWWMSFDACVLLCPLCLLGHLLLYPWPWTLEHDQGVTIAADWTWWCRMT